MEKEILKEREARKKLQRKLNEIRARKLGRNEDARAEVVSTRIDYPVLFVNVNGLLFSV
jgi:hypothetical protein